MRPRFALTIILCLLSVSVTLPASALGSDREHGNARFEFRDLWAGLVAWVEAIALTIDPNGLAVSLEVSSEPGVAASGKQPAAGFDAGPNK